jgi:hypothetical protein
MRNVRTFVTTALAIAAAVVVTGCASKGTDDTVKKAEKAADSVKPTQRTEVLDDKGAAFGIQTPTWMTAYIANNNTGVEKLADYKDKYCFVVEYTDVSKDFAVAWVQNASGPQAIAAKVATTVASDASNTMKGEKGAGVEANLKAATEQLSNASFNGATKEGDWWQYIRNTTTGAEEYRAYALWVITKKQLDQQVAANLQRIVDQNKAMSEAEKSIYADLIAGIRANGGLTSDN